MAKKIISVAALVVLLLLSLAMIIYPFFSNWYYDYTKSMVITAYQESETDADLTAQRITALEAAEAYNAQLARQAVVVADPFVQMPSEHTDNAAELLDITGTGVLCYLDIPEIDVYLPVYYGTSESTLEHGAGILEGTSLPVGGQSSHCVISGHSGLSSAKLFTDLELMREGDYFFLHTLGNVLTYQVDQITVVQPSDVSQIAIAEGQDYCTLLTCTPYGVNSHRLLVRGTRVSNLPAEEMDELNRSRDSSSDSIWMQEYVQSIFIGLAVLALLLIGFFVFRLLRKHLKQRGDSK